MLKLNLGCGTNILPGWANHDEDVDLRKRLPWNDGAAQFILLEHVLEHFNCAVGYGILEECCRVLAPGGVLRICVPSVLQIEHADQSYVDFLVKNGWDPSPVRAIATTHGHEMLWTVETLSAVLRSIGLEPRHCQPRISTYPELCNIEGHQHVIGMKFNDLETLVVEGTKRKKGSQSFSVKEGLPTPFSSARRTGTAIVTVVDAQRLESAIGLLESVHQCRPDDAVEICVMHVGLSSDQVARLSAHATRVFDAGAIAFRDHVAIHRIPEMVSDVETVIHLSSDCWLQDWRGIELLIEAAKDGALAVVPEMHRAFAHLFEPVNEIRLSQRKNYEAAYGDQVARQLTWKPVFSPAVFALKRDAAFWKLWEKSMQAASARGMDASTEKTALNHAIATYAPPMQTLPQWVNWPCALATPMLDQSANKLVEPTMPHEPISIVQQGSRAGSAVRLKTTAGTILNTQLNRANVARL